MEGNTGSIAWVQEWLDWLHREWSGLWRELQDTEGRDRVWDRVKAHLREWIVYYVFGVCLLVIGYGLWMDRDSEGERVARGSGNGRKAVMTGGAPTAYYGIYESEFTPEVKALLNSPDKFANEKIKAIQAIVSKVNKNNQLEARKSQGTLSANQLLEAHIQSKRITALKPTTVNRTKSVNNIRGEIGVTGGTQSNVSILDPQPGNQGGGGKGGGGNANKQNKTKQNKTNILAIVPDPKPKQSVVGSEIVPITELAEISTKGGGGANTIKPPIGSSSQPTGPPPGVPLSALFGARAGARSGAEAGAQVSVTITNPVAAPAAAPAATPATTNSKQAKEPEANQPQPGPAKPQQAPTQGQEPQQPQKADRKDQGAEGVKQAVAAALAKKGQEGQIKAGKKQETKQIKAQVKQASAQFKRKTAGIGSMDQLLLQIKQGAGQQVDKVGGVLFSLLTMLGLATAAGTVALERTGFDPARRVIKMATRI